MVSVTHDQGRIQGVCNLHQPFSNMFLMYRPTNFPLFQTFSIAVSLTPQARLIENVRTKCIIFDEALRIRVKNFKQNLRENYSKSTKIAIAACTFSKFVRGSMSLDPLRAFPIFQSAPNSFRRKKYA